MPSYADSYDVLGRVLVEQGEMAQAYEIYRKAADGTDTMSGDAHLVAVEVRSAA